MSYSIDILRVAQPPPILGYSLLEGTNHGPPGDPSRPTGMSRPIFQFHREAISRWPVGSNQCEPDCRPERTTRDARRVWAPGRQTARAPSTARTPIRPRAPRRQTHAYARKTPSPSSPANRPSAPPVPAPGAIPTGINDEDLDPISFATASCSRSRGTSRISNWSNQVL